jgi:hypothetical protein
MKEHPRMPHAILYQDIVCAGLFADWRAHKSMNVVVMARHTAIPA